METEELEEHFRTHWSCDAASAGHPKNKGRRWQCDAIAAAAIWLPAVPAFSEAFSDMSRASAEHGEVPGWLQSFRAAARFSQSRMSMSKRGRTSRISRKSKKSKESRKFSRQSRESKSLALLSQEQSLIRDARHSDHSAEAEEVTEEVTEKRLLHGNLTGCGCFRQNVFHL